MLDFSGCNLNLRTLDVAKAICTFGDLDSDQGDLETAVLFLQAYLRCQRLTEREVMAFPDLVRWSVLRSLVWNMDYQMTAHERQMSQAALVQWAGGLWQANLRIQADAARWQEMFGNCRNQIHKPWRGRLHVAPSMRPIERGLFH